MKSFPAIHAVLTGDIVNSTRLAIATEKALIAALKETLHPYKHEFYRGDSFQVYLKDPMSALRLALLCRTQAISISAEKEEDNRSDVRIGIGIGEVLPPVRDLGTAKGEAFLLSGRSFDMLQTPGKGNMSESRLAITSGHRMADTGFQVLAGHIDAIYEKMTVKQAMAVIGLLKGQTQQAMAIQLGKSNSTVSQLVNAAGWPFIERLLQQYESLINLLYDDRISLVDKINHRTPAD